MRDGLTDAFDYGLWANGLWLTAVDGFSEPAKARSVLRHILFAELMWQDRIHDRVPDDHSVYESVPLTFEEFEKSARAWQEWIRTVDLSATKPFQRMDGTRFLFAYGDVARHVANHGTYHRGHLRGLADAEGWDGFEDTDWTAWLRASGRAAQV